MASSQTYHSFQPCKSQGHAATSKVSAVSAQTEKLMSRKIIPLSSCIVPLQGDQEHGTVTHTNEMMTMSPEKMSPSKPMSHRENFESCEVTLNTSTNEIGGEFEYEKCEGSNINKIQSCLTKPQILISITKP